jgi:hypothetical protein
MMYYVNVHFILKFVYVQGWVGQSKLEGHKIRLWLRTLCTLSDCILSFCKCLLFDSEVYISSSQNIQDVQKVTL